jgi:hypothetical protein
MSYGGTYYGAFAMTASLFLTTGCATSGTNVAPWNPFTWFSGSEARKVDSTSTKEEKARHEAVKAAQESAVATAVALSKAPASLPVAKATDFNATTSTLLDQAEGPLTVEQKAKVSAIAEKVVSENPEVRKQGEAELAKKNSEFAEISAKLAAAEANSNSAKKELREAFTRENALANELRNQRFMLWAAIGVAVLLGIGWLYVKVALGGVPVALGRALGDLRIKSPQVADALTPILDQYLNRNEQALVAKNAR